MALVDVPLANETLGETQNDIRSNFSNIDSQFAIDHQQFNTTGNGKHNRVTFLQQANSNPDVTGNDIRMYGLNDAVSGQSELFIKRASDGAGNGLEFTKYYSNNPSSTSSSINYTILPSGVIIQWGVGTCTSGNTSTINFGTTGVAPRGGIAYSDVNAYIVQLTAINYNGTVSLRTSTSGTATTFTVAANATGSGSSTINFAWMTIGK